MSIRDQVRHSSGFLWRLRRYPSRGWVAGVCAGLAEHFDWNVKLLRVICIIGLVCSGFFPIGLIYVGLWYLMDDGDKNPLDGDEELRDRDRKAWSGAAWSGSRSARRERSRYDYAPPPSPVDPRARFAHLERRLRSMEECVASKDFELRRELKKLES